MHLDLTALSLALGAAFTLPANAQQTTGAPGSPGATMSISGKQLPAPDPKFGGVIKVDGKEVATKKMAWIIPFILQFDESFDIGSDTLTGVDDKDYQVPFTLTAKLDILTIKLLDRPKLSPEDIKKLESGMQQAGRVRE